MSEIFNQLMVFGFTALPFVVALGLALGFCVAVLVFPRPLLLLLLAATVIFPSSPTDALGNATGFNVYGKGGGYLFFSLYELSLVFLSLGALLLAGWRTAGKGVNQAVANEVRGDPYFAWYLCFGVLFAGYVAIWFSEQYDRWPVVFTRAGVINVIFQGCLVAALISHLRDPGVRHRMFAALGGIAAIMMVWGLFRYVALGGDPQGSYEEHGGTGLLRITYWDINYSIIAAMLAGWCTWELSVRKGLSLWVRVGLISLLIVCLADIALSARRTGQIGLFLSLLVVLLLLPKGRRTLVLTLFAIALPLVAYKLNERITDNRSVLQKIVQGDERKQYLVDVRYERSYELRLAMEEIRKSPVFGVGPGGIFQPKSSIGLQYHQGNYGFIHSGLGHVLFKTGVVGLAIFCGLLATYLSLLRRSWPLAEGRDKSLLVASMCGMACSLPNLLVGTPIIEIRSMVVMGVCLAIPALLRRRDARPSFAIAKVRAI